MLSPIALQLYTVRNAMSQDAEGVLRRVVEMGYVGAETGLMDQTGEPTMARLCKKLGLQVPSVLTNFPFDDSKRAALDEVAALGCRYVGISWYPPEKLKTVDDVKQLCDLLNAADEIAQRHGLTMIYHNHWAEAESMADGRTPLQLLFEYTRPSVQFEIDVYWAQTGGSDPVAVVKQGGTRIPILHIKDGPAVRGEPMVAVGEGSVDIAGVVRAGEGHTQWLIVELDECATDMLAAVEKSYRYLIEKGLGRGNKG
jgi:sugar phosphate isomerase/epimerase